MNQPLSNIPPDPILRVKEHLAAQKVTRVGIVDDGFDAPNAEDKKENWAEFVQHANATMPLSRQLDELGLEPDGSEELNEIAEMERKIREKGGELASELDRLVSAMRNLADAEISNLTNLLEGRLALDLRKVGTDAHRRVNELVGTQIVFLDYYLGDENPSGVTAAVSVVKKLCAQCDKRRKPQPMFVLFSRSNLSRADVNSLRKRAKIPAWQFRFVPKRNLVRDADIVLRLWELANGLDGVRGIEKFLHGFRNTIVTAQAELEKSLNDLDLSDIAYLDMMKLNDESASLSQYMTWLFGAYLHNTILRDEDYQRVAEKLDKVDLSKLPSRHVEPTRQVLDLYRHVLYEPGYRKLGWDEKRRRVSRLQLGEIYIRAKRGGTKDALLVLNNSCDLARPAKDMTVALLRGELIDRQKAPNLGSTPRKTRSDAFGLEGKHYVLDWFLDRSENISHGSVFNWLKREKYDLVARMRLENALEIKQLYLTRLDRIGLPIAPPMLAQLQITGVFWRDPKQKAQMLFDRSDANTVEVFVIDTYNDSGDKDQRFFFTSDFLARLSDGIKEKFKSQGTDGTLKKLNLWCSNYGKLTAFMHPKKKGELDPVAIRIGAPLQVDEALPDGAKSLVVCVEFRP